MAERPEDEEEAQEAGKDRGAGSGAGPEQKPDLRFTSIEQGGVRVDRDLSGSGHLSRGSRTNMSNMRFSVRAQPRDELDPELQALRPKEPAVAPPRAAAPDPPAASVPPPAAAAPAAAPTPAPEPSAPVADGGGGFIAAIKRLFS